PSNERTTRYTRTEALRIETALLSPVLPQSTAKIWAQLSMKNAVDEVQFAGLEWGGLQTGQKIGEVSAVFPRLEMKEAVAAMRDLEEQVSAAQAALLGKAPAP